MQLTEVLRERLASEYRLASTLMSASESAREKLFYFSVIYLEAGRIINWKMDPDLVLIWAVTQWVHQTATAKFQRMAQGDITPVPDDFIAQLTQATVELAQYVENDGSGQELARLMGVFSQIGYATTGNGYYLIQKASITESQPPT